MNRFVTDRFVVTYGLTANNEEDAKQMAFSIQIEQTIEFPYELLSDEWIKNNIVGQLESLTSVGNNEYEAKISYASDLVGGEVSQFINLIFGNSSLQPGIWIKDLELSPSLWQMFKGPSWGIEGVRSYLNVPHRPMLQAVIKPIGTSNENLADMCRAYAEGGVDVIKDDHGITNQNYSLFKERVQNCVEAINEGKIKSNAHTMYAANVTADGEETIERAFLAKELGANAIMVAPAIVGFGTMHRLASDKSLNLPIISHPALSGGFTMEGVSGISAKVWFGTLSRLCGADMPIFVSYGGRFSYSKELCRDIIKTLLGSHMPIKKSCPSPGGGVTAARLPELFEVYGRDVMYLVGGDMFRRGTDLTDNAKYFIELLEKGVHVNSPIYKVSE